VVTVRQHEPIFSSSQSTALDGSSSRPLYTGFDHPFHSVKAFRLP